MDSLLLRFFILMLLAGAVYGLAWSVTLAVRNRGKVLKELKKVSRNRQMTRMRRIILMVAAVLLVVGFIIRGVGGIMLTSLAVVIVFGLYLWIFARLVERCCMQRWVSPKELTEGDWVVDRVMDGKRVVCDPKDLGLENDQISRLVKMQRKGKIKKVLIKEGIPFVPSFLAAFVLAFLLPDLLMGLL